MDEIKNCVFQKSADSKALAPMQNLNSEEKPARQGPASQGDREANDPLASSFKSNEFVRFSSGEFDRVSDDNENAADSGDKIRPVLATPENTTCYSRFANHPVRVEGPEFSQDFTYYLVDKMEALRNFEKGISLAEFNSSLVTKRIELEFRTLQKMCFHKDHVLNLFTSFDIQFHKINRYKDILPFLHNRVKLKENPLLPAPTSGEDGSSNENESAQDENRKRSKQIDDLIDIHGSDSRLQTYFNASYINSMIRTTQQRGSSYIASSSPGLKTSKSQVNDEEPEPTPAEENQMGPEPLENQPVQADGPRQALKSIGPSPSFANFWQMVWDNDIHLIVMLCPIMGLMGVEESCPYWDQMYQDPLHRVTVQAVTDRTSPTDGVTRRLIRLQKRDHATGEPVSERVIEHYQMLSWADNTAIEENSEQFAALNYLLSKVFESKREKPDCPVLVHCSAGIGRTGTFLAICLMIEAIKELQRLKKERTGSPNGGEEIKDAEQSQTAAMEVQGHMADQDALIEPRVSIFGSVRRLREQRCYMVKKQSQYVFLYTYLALWIKHDIENGSDPDQVLFNFGTGSAQQNVRRNNTEEATTP